MPWWGYVVVPASLLIVIAITQVVASVWYALLRWSASHRNRAFVLGSVVLMLALVSSSISTFESLAGSTDLATPGGTVNFQPGFNGLSALYVNAWALVGLVLGLRDRSARLGSNRNLQIYQGSLTAQFFSGASGLSLVVGIVVLLFDPASGIALVVASPLLGWVSYRLAGGRDNPQVLLAYWKDHPECRGDIGNGAPGFSWRARIIAKFTTTLDDARGDVAKAIAVLAMRGGAPGPVAVAYDRVLSTPTREHWDALREVMCVNPPPGFK